MRQGVFRFFSLMKTPKEDTSRAAVGGQAVIEGVMMRSPEAVVVAVRRPDGAIVYRRRSFRSLSASSKLWGAAVLRGAVVLVESLVLGMEALSFSSRVVMEDETSATRNGPQALWSRLLTIFTVVAALAVGIGLFFYLPLLVAHVTGVRSGLAFNLIDGAVRLLLFVGYLVAVGQWKEIRRVFEYHGAEHMSIHAYEAGGALSIEEAARHSPSHPRCGTSFLLVVAMVSVIVFVVLPRPHTPLDPLVALRLLLVPLVAGLSYEVLKLAARWPDNPLLRPLVAAGTWLQRLTTRIPDPGQLEVALVALKSALGHDVSALAQDYEELMHKTEGILSARVEA
ncbi:MAG: DUF1385 domain-containing protein [candidate division KSB1 bacterium]|nr:DUF1385 domain-containing protein [candidate division KSB1 bacterium]MDZ7295655.1 DUF1385 domain-containing protein [candidate division KSB1 bacterium]MDZ7391886.1 DUF1385 domain-containing protein [candidate division KSB1 bacterium]MDZ7412507.1 DUF1385 domain-containing protein [candidate division KSB1 bacterium]